MNYEKIAWFIFWFTFGILILMLFYGFSVLVLTATSVEFAYLLGLVSFLILGNRLLFGYGWIANLLDHVISFKQITSADRQKLEKKLENKQPEEMIKEFSFKALLILALKDLDYYRYAYYGIFLLLVLITLMAKFNLLGEMVIGKYIEGVFWGAATTVFFVWGLEQLAKVSFVEYNLLNLEEKNKNGGQ
ncbi:hypothetical protein [Persephonella sp.]|uniref:hypothetical protein n=1 Tax=Persephonella sp. TaxID=2060922 RepID=UPI00260A812A|nr:hypothetical protein [Persephonella sp.]